MFERKTAKLNERNRQILVEEKKRCGIMGKRFRLLFWTSIISVASTAMTIVNSLCIKNEDLVLPLLAVGTIASIFSIIILFMLGKYNANFTAAAVICIMTQISSVFEEMSTGEVNTVLLFFTVFLSIVFVSKYSTGMEESCMPADEYLAGSWASYRKAYVVISIGKLCCVMAAYTPILAFLAVIASVLFAIAAIVVDIIQLNLLHRSPKTMAAYSQAPVLG
ncbi:MAG: hypothetical protein J5752_10130 [Clostridiales bacterium]|nr:hypothetical protein [Clostridiales bacterium]